MKAQLKLRLPDQNPKPKLQEVYYEVTVATVEDRIVQTAMKLIIEPIFEADFHDCSYGYRPKRSAKQASLAIHDDLYQHAWGVVEIDFKSYFSSIPHDKLITPPTMLQTFRFTTGWIST